MNISNNNVYKTFFITSMIYKKKPLLKRNHNQIKCSNKTICKTFHELRHTVTAISVGKASNINSIDILSITKSSGIQHIHRSQFQSEEFVRNFRSLDW